MADLSGRGVRVLLIGTAEHSGTSLPSLPSVERSLVALEKAMLGTCNVAPANLRTLLNPPDARTMAEAITDVARSADSLLLIYFIGHGLLGPRGQLHLAAANTDKLTPGLAGHQALPFSAVTEAISICRASSVVVVLDCCSSARADATLPPESLSIPLPAAHGTYLLASAERLALAPDDREFTLFTGSFLQMLTTGDPLGPRWLTLDSTYEYLFRTIRALDGPLPTRRSTDRAGDLVLTSNRSMPVVNAEVNPQEDLDPSAHSPYLGLSAFTVDDASLFRGRDQLADDLVIAAEAAGNARSLLMVIGSSGAGKTSLLQAGLLARLREGTPDLPDSVRWPWIVMTPGEAPLQALAARLGAGPGSEAALRDDPGSAATFADDFLRSDPRAASATSRRLVLVVDQFEQLFTLGADTQEQTAFVRAVTAIAHSPGTAAPIVILALRADFYGQAASHVELASTLRDHQFLVLPMGADDLRAAIEEPADQVGLDLDDGLADVLLHEVGALDRSGAAAGALPLLSHTLWSLWQRRSGRRLTLAGYRATGGIAEAIATTANAVYTALDPAAQEAARQMLPRLVRIEDDGPDTAQPQNLSVLRASSNDPAAAQRALDQMAKSRLLTLEQEVARISHEVLLHSWPLLRDWIEADRAWLRAQQQLAQDAQSWHSSTGNRDLLYRGSRLLRINELVHEAAATPVLEPQVAEFLSASSAQERRSALIRRALLATLVLLLVLATVGGGAAWVQQRRATQQRDVARAQFIGSQSDILRTTNPNLATQLALVARGIDPKVSESALFANRNNIGVFDHQDAVVDFALPAVGKLMAISTGEGLRIWDLRGAGVARIDQPTTGPVVFGSSGTFIAAAFGTKASGEHDDYVRNRNHLGIWDLTDPARPRPQAEWSIDAPDIVSLALSPDQRLLAAGSTDGHLHLWDIRDRQHPTKLTVLTIPGGLVDSLAFAPVGLRLASLGGDHNVRLWDLGDARHPRQLWQQKAAAAKLDARLPSMRHRVAFNENGKHLVVPGKGAKTYDNLYPELWELAETLRPRKLTVKPDLTPCSRELTALVVKGDYVYQSCGQQITILYRNPGIPRELRVISTLETPDGRLGALALADDGHRLLSASPQGVLAWNLDTTTGQPGAFVSLSLNSGFLGGTMAFTRTPGGRVLLADTGYLGILRLTDVTDPKNAKIVATYKAAETSARGYEIQALTNSVAFSPDGRLFAYARVAKHRAQVLVHRTDSPTGAPIATIDGLDNGAMSMTFGVDNRTLAVVDNAAALSFVVKPVSIKFFDTSLPQERRLITSIPAPVYGLSFSPDGRLMAGYADNRVYLWAVTRSGRPQGVPQQRRTVGTTGGQFSADGRLLLVGDETSLRIWNVTERTLTAEPVIVDIDGPGSAAAMSPDGRTVAVPSNGPRSLFNGAVQLWDVSDPSNPSVRGTWTAVHRYTGPPAAVAFSPDNQTLAVMGYGDTDGLDLWDLNPDRIASTMCSWVGDTISRSEWKLYATDLPYAPPCPHIRARTR